MRRLKHREADEIVEGRPWFLIVCGVAFLVYLAIRLVQMAGWVLEAVF